MSQPQPTPQQPELVDELIAERKTGRAMPDDMPPWMAGTIVRLDKLSYFCRGDGLLADAADIYCDGL